MGVLFAYGDNANFVLSVGGFHPQFNPPPLPFPTPQRIEIDLINESFARIRCGRLLRRHDEHGPVRRSLQFLLRVLGAVRSKAVRASTR